jgi:predicted transcriptional regulator
MARIGETPDPELERRLAELDDAHRRARSPAARRRIEQQMVAAREESRKIAVAGQAVDRAYERWVWSLGKHDA